MGGCLEPGGDQHDRAGNNIAGRVVGATAACRQECRDRPRDSAVPALLLWIGLLLVTYWWIVDGGVADLGQWASGLTSLGRLTGLWAADLLLIQVLLMSRFPMLEHAFGRDQLARIHRVIGQDLISFRSEHRQQPINDHKQRTHHAAVDHDNHLSRFCCPNPLGARPGPDHRAEREDHQSHDLAGAERESQRCRDQ